MATTAFKQGTRIERRALVEVGPGLLLTQNASGDPYIDINAGAGGTATGHNHNDLYFTEDEALALFRSLEEQVPWTDITGAPETATRWPTWYEVAELPVSFNPSAHAASHAQGGTDALSLAWAQVSKVASSLEDIAVRSAGALNSGNLPHAQLPTGAGQWNWGAGNLLTETGNRRLNGSAAFNGPIVSGFGVMYYTGAVGFQAETAGGNSGFRFRASTGAERGRLTWQEAAGYFQMLCQGGYGYNLQVTRNTTATTALYATDQTVNVGIRTMSQFGSGSGVLGIANALAVPSTVQTDGVVAWAQGGALKAQGTSGTITTVAAADPHCPTCARDFALEYESANPAHPGYLALCAWCLAEVLRDNFGGKGIIAMQEQPRDDEPRGLLLTTLFKHMEAAR